ncbi:sigma-E factor negative regulatory protein [Thermomonas sp.]|uniref:sigma-E factor negative regulatory protein n=1 Tax=Thermomonas sp. TaxID=1971895 RepID=UPI002C847437|nr:sigma-E factor negative regulatory protein [Thermomonas sp.]HRO63335.1 sigma-E factor negative regulatory protein [Thermomonas sp.]
MNHDTDRHCNDLTQLCSREQLSALMDGALPEDQTRFLLRRLQHDAALAGCWGRWRTAADAMRGIAPGRCLPADFASRVAIAIQEDAPLDAAARASARASQRRRWGGGAALAAALATLAILGLPTGESGAPHSTPAVAVRDAEPAVPARPAGAPAPQQPSSSDTLPPAAFEAAASLAAATSATRANRRKAQGEGAEPGAIAPAHVQQAAPMEFAVAAPPAAEISARPWPRSVLPQYGTADLTVGLGELPARSADADSFRASSTFAQPPRLLKAAEPAAEPSDQPLEQSDSAAEGKGKAKTVVPAGVQP